MSNSLRDNSRGFLDTAHARVHDELALSSQRSVSPSLQPGTAKRGAAAPWGTTTGWRARRCDGRCAVAALAEAHKVMNRLRAETEARTEAKT